MNNIITGIIAFSIGIICGAIFFSCGVKAYDDPEIPRFGDSYMDRYYQQQRLQDVEQRQQQQEWNRQRPCQ